MPKDSRQRTLSLFVVARFQKTRRKFAENTEIDLKFVQRQPRLPPASRAVDTVRNVRVEKCPTSRRRYFARRPRITASPIPENSAKHSSKTSVPRRSFAWRNSLRGLYKSISLSGPSRYLTGWIYKSSSVLRARCDAQHVKEIERPYYWCFIIF